MNDDSGNDPSSRLKDLVSQIDESVPREGAWIELTQYGGAPEESRMVGNVNGYRRLGIELLKASMTGAENFYVDLNDLVTSRSTVKFDWFELRDTVPQPEVQTWGDRVFTIGCLALVLIGGVFSLIGVVVVTMWALGIEF